MQREIVSLCSIDGDLSQSISRAIQLLGGFEEILPGKGDTVLIKPNVGWSKTWETGTTTSPHFVRALVDLLEKQNPGRIIIGESPSIGMRGEEVFRETGYDKLRDIGVEVIDLGKDSTYRLALPEGSLLEYLDLPVTYRDADYFVNVPVIKTHVNTCVTIACKNLKGLLPSREKKRFHFLGLDRCIAELVSMVETDLVIVDGQVGQEGLGPISGKPVDVGAVLAGTNPVAVDATCIKAMGIGPARVKHLNVAMEMGLSPPLGNIEVVGDPASDVFRPFEQPPEKFSSAYEGINIVDGNACSGCIGSLTVSLERMAEAGELDELRGSLGRINIALGPDAEIPEGELGHWVIMGNCLKDRSSEGKYVPGCSPQGWYVRDILRGLMGLPPLFVDETLLNPDVDDVEEQIEE
jgi:uncharacterized protein (DUF362 family)